MKKILLINNSLGVDLTQYFHSSCRQANEDVLTACLYIGAGNNPMVGATVAVAVAVEEASK